MKFTSFGRNRSVSVRSAAILLAIAVGLGLTAPSVCAEEVSGEPEVMAPVEEPTPEPAPEPAPEPEPAPAPEPVIPEPVTPEPVIEEPAPEPVTPEPVIEEPAPEPAVAEPAPDPAQQDASSASSAVSTSSVVSTSATSSSSTEPAETEEVEVETEEVEEITDIDPDIDEEEMRRILEEYFAYGSIEKLMESVEIVEAPEIREDFRFETIRKNPAWALTNSSIREEKSTDSRMVGALPRNGICYIIKNENDGWVYVESGDVRGFIQEENLTVREPVIEEPEMAEQEPESDEPEMDGQGTDSDDSEMNGQEPAEDDSTDGTAAASAATSTGSVQAEGTGLQDGAIHPGFAEAAESVFSAETTGSVNSGDSEESISGGEAEESRSAEEIEEAYRRMHTPGPLVIRNIREEQEAQEKLISDLRTLGVKEKTENTPPEAPDAGMSGSDSQEVQVSYSIKAAALPEEVLKEEQTSYSIAVTEIPEPSLQDTQVIYSTDTTEAGESTESGESVSESEESIQDGDETLTDELFEDGYPLAVEYIPHMDNSAYDYVHKTTRETVVPKKGATSLSEISIREDTFDSARSIGYLPENGLCYILQDAGDGWVFVESGDVRGFVRSDELDLLSDEMNSKTDDELYSEGHLTAEENVKPADNYSLYYTLTSVRERSQESYTRQAMMDFASQFVGRPYVWGGNDLMNGVDCSGFVREVYKAFGYDLPRIAAVQAYEGIQIPVDEAEPGDLIFYANSNGYIYHVVMSTGNGGTIEAMSASMGIVYSTVSGDAVWAARIIEDA